MPQRKKKEICGIAKPVPDTSPADHSARLRSPIESHFAVTPTGPSAHGSPANGFTSADGGRLLREELDYLDASEPPRTAPADDDLVPIHSTSASFEDLKHSNDDSLNNPTPARDDIDSKLTKDNSSKESIVDIVLVNDNIDMKSSMCSDVAPVHWSKSMDRLGELLSPAEETISMFTQLSDKLSEVSAAEGDSGVDTAHVSDDEACRPEKWTILDLQFGIPLFDEALCESVCGSVVGCVAAPDVLDKIKEDNEFIRADVLKFVSQCQYYPGEDMGIVKRGTLVPLPRKSLAFENGRISEWNGK